MEERSDPLADLALVKDVLNGDRRALAALAERMECVPRILAARNRRSGSPLRDEDLDDVAQSVLLIAWRKLPEFQGRAALETWLYRICCLEFLNAVRRRAHAPRTTDGIADGAFRASSGASSEPELAPELEYEGLYLGLERLEPSASEIIRMKHFEERTFDEISRALGLGIDAVKSRYYRGMQALQRLLVGRGENEGWI